jgi:hypothetical protein
MMHTVSAFTLCLAVLLAVSHPAAAQGPSVTRTGAVTERDCAYATLTISSATAVDLANCTIGALVVYDVQSGATLRVVNTTLGTDGATFKSSLAKVALSFEGVSMPSAATYGIYFREEVSGSAIAVDHSDIKAIVIGLRFAKAVTDTEINVTASTVSAVGSSTSTAIDFAGAFSSSQLSVGRQSTLTASSVSSQATVYGIYFRSTVEAGSAVAVTDSSVAALSPYVARGMYLGIVRDASCVTLERATVDARCCASNVCECLNVHDGVAVGTLQQGSTVSLKGSTVTVRAKTAASAVRISAAYDSFVNVYGSTLTCNGESAKSTYALLVSKASATMFVVSENTVAVDQGYLLGWGAASSSTFSSSRFAFFSNTLGAGYEAVFYATWPSPTAKVYAACNEADGGALAVPAALSLSQTCASSLPFERCGLNADVANMVDYQGPAPTPRPATPPVYLTGNQALQDIVGGDYQVSSPTDARPLLLLTLDNCDLRSITIVPGSAKNLVVRITNSKIGSGGVVFKAAVQSGSQISIVNTTIGIAVKGVAFSSYVVDSNVSIVDSTIRATAYGVYGYHTATRGSLLLQRSAIVVPARSTSSSAWGLRWSANNHNLTISHSTIFTTGGYGMYGSQVSGTVTVDASSMSGGISGLVLSNAASTCLVVTKSNISSSSTFTSACRPLWLPWWSYASITVTESRLTAKCAQPAGVYAGAATQGQLNLIWNTFTVTPYSYTSSKLYASSAPKGVYMYSGSSYRTYFRTNNVTIADNTFNVSTIGYIVMFPARSYNNLFTVYNNVFGTYASIAYKDCCGGSSSSASTFAMACNRASGAADAATAPKTKLAKAIAGKEGCPATPLPGRCERSTLRMSLSPSSGRKSSGMSPGVIIFLAVLGPAIGLVFFVSFSIGRTMKRKREALEASERARNGNNDFGDAKGMFSVSMSPVNARSDYGPDVPASLGRRRSIDAQPLMRSAEPPSMGETGGSLFE